MRSRPGTPIAADPFTEAVESHWITAGTGPSEPITQLEFDRGVVRVLGLKRVATSHRPSKTAGGWKPQLPTGFGVEQVVRAIGARCERARAAPTTGRRGRPSR